MKVTQTGINNQHSIIYKEKTMENMEQLKKNKIFMRIIEYRIDFAYTRQSYFNAFSRVNKQNKRTALLNNLLGLFSILIAIFTLSALTLYLTRAAKEINIIYIVSGLSIISIIISIYLYSFKNPDNNNLYLDRAEAYSVLYKQAKNFEAICQTDLEIANEKLREKLVYFENEQEKLLKLSLDIKKEDYDLAKEQIRNRKNYGYDDLDENNT